MGIACTSSGKGICSVGSGKTLLSARRKNCRMVWAKARPCGVTKATTSSAPKIRVAKAARETRCERPEQLVEEKEMRQVLLKAIQSLPPEQRRVVVMRYFLDMSATDMSTRMDRPLSTIKWWLRDARKRLYELVRPQGGSR